MIAKHSDDGRYSNILASNFLLTLILGCAKATAVLGGL